MSPPHTHSYVYHRRTHHTTENVKSLVMSDMLQDIPQLLDVPKVHVLPRPASDSTGANLHIYIAIWTSKGCFLMYYLTPCFAFFLHVIDEDRCSDFGTSVGLYFCSSFVYRSGTWRNLPGNRWLVVIGSLSLNKNQMVQLTSWRLVLWLRDLHIHGVNCFETLMLPGLTRYAYWFLLLHTLIIHSSN